ncbi:hypothetical protein ACU6T4_07535 [Avibacterium paragallinarum]|uniref:Uncharacterized protein n=1 Tax=Avibacterium paragallinarum TaxID=728 RepID=A0A0F5ES83_AVIPA|nr:hypothetical protein [Avibacterium paragallinarum]AZI13585.1 hypothetical protein EIA51_02370 [Avibacterium paragallinarum]KAA6207895.1 hypothetical protein F1968_12280 [Avibacterium paragallinarum]KKA99452.1 hypothetical protein Z012_11935 [Avibacterium paragallinarum]QIR12100.1 hypothetical protein HBL79_07565 [Avibacterium paragallinarum]QJE09080.1 hypothetical protein HHJ62_01485 [Avibacterium paragallinarum]
MKVSKENQEWIKQYAQIHQLTEEEAVNKLIGEVRDTQETARQNMQKEIIERLPNLNFEQMREVRQLIERLYPTFFQVLSQASKNNP